MAFTLDSKEQTLLNRLEKRERGWKKYRWVALAAILVLLSFNLWHMSVDINAEYEVQVANAQIPQEPIISIATLVVFTWLHAIIIIFLSILVVLVLSNWQGSAQRQLLIKLLRYHVMEGEVKNTVT